MKKTLLLADDSPTIQKVINLTFADEGIDVIAVSDGNAAIQQLREMKPDLVMADVHMPGLNGYQICELLRQNAELKDVPVILLVGSFEPFDEEEAKRVGADDFLMKPFQSIRQLVSRVAALLEPEQEAVQSPLAEAPAMRIATPNAPEVEKSSETEAAYTDAGEAHSDFAAPVETPPPSINFAETGFAEIVSREAAVQEDDDLSDFDKEFDRKFPDAVSLSSGQIEAVSYPPERSYPAPEPVYPQPEQGYSDEEPLAETAQIHSIEEASPEPEPTYPEPEQGYSPEEEGETLAETAPQAEEQLHAESPLSIEIPALPEEDLNRIVALQQPEQFSPQRISDEVEEKSIELVSTETDESFSVLDLGNLGRFGEGREENILLDIENGEPAAEEVDEGEKYVTPVTEAVNAIVSEQMAEQMPVDIPAQPAYDFRSPDAFDEDTDIQETFHGLPKIEEVPEPVALAEPVAPSADVAEASLERVVDEEAEGHTPEDQADGFSGPAEQSASPISAPSPEAVDAAAQKVFEQISEKVVTEMVRGLMPQIKDLIAREIAKENE